MIRSRAFACPAAAVVILGPPLSARQAMPCLGPIDVTGLLDGCRFKRPDY